MIRTEVSCQNSKGFLTIEEKHSFFGAVGAVSFTTMVSRILAGLRCKLLWVRVRRRASLAVAFSEFARERAERRYSRRAHYIEDALWRLDKPAGPTAHT
jgi:hypothetical protein